MVLVWWCDGVVWCQKKEMQSISTLTAAVVLVLAVAVGVSNAHMCLVGPPQRNGPVTLTAAADPRCALQTAPCGGYGPEFPGMTAVHAGNNLTVTFQKNVNHFKAGIDSEFRISFSLTSEPKLNFTLIKTLPDDNSPALTIYQTTIPTATTFAQRGVLQVVYDTKQGDVFYQV